MKEVKVCNLAKDKITKHVEALKAVSQESVYATQHVQKSVEGLNQEVNEIKSVAHMLKDYAKTLENQIQHFTVK